MCSRWHSSYAQRPQCPVTPLTRARLRQASSAGAAAFTALALLKNMKRAMFVIGLAVFGYAYRILVHVLLIRQSAWRRAVPTTASAPARGPHQHPTPPNPRAPAHAPRPPTVGTLDEPHCGTVKSISGHVHFFAFHIVFFACAYLQFCTAKSASGPAQRTHSVQRKKKSGKKASANEVTLDELAEFLGYLCFAIMVVSAYLSMHATYFSGFHSARCGGGGCGGARASRPHPLTLLPHPRQMVAGAAFAFGGSIACQLVAAFAEPFVVGPTKKRGPKGA